MSIDAFAMGWGLAAGIAGGILLLLILTLIGMYNGLVSKRLQVRSAWAQIDVQLKRRYDLIPNLVETVKGYASHEKSTLENVIKARNAAASAHGAAEAGRAEGALSGALRQLFALSEAYPELKANTNFQQLSEELSSTENKISHSRQHYNNTVEIYNTSIATFPAVMVAGMFGFREEEFFEVTSEAERQAPRVQFT
ncbi:MAG: LemA family protein [Phycisphaerae bacterium]|nr:LemA family protein [Phycisphaerae bacterium]